MSVFHCYCCRGLTKTPLSDACSPSSCTDMSILDFRNKAEVSQQQQLLWICE